MKVLVACEESQRVCIQFRERGHEAYSCDIIECSGGHPEWHIKADARALLHECVGFITQNGDFHFIEKWDMLIAHPPCTYLSNAGARHLYKGGMLNQERYNKGMEARDFFMRFYNAPIDKIAVENPIPSKVYKLPKYTQIIEPYMFGHPVTKKTCLWLRGLEPLKPTDIVKPEQGRVIVVNGRVRRSNWTMDRCGKERQKERSKTFQGIAIAMAEQWGTD